MEIKEKEDKEKGTGEEQRWQNDNNYYLIITHLMPDTSLQLSQQPQSRYSVRIVGNKSE